MSKLCSNCGKNPVLNHTRCPDHPITDKEAAKKMKLLGKDRDIEMSHGIADDLLVEIIRQAGFKKTADAYEQLTRWYS